MALNPAAWREYRVLVDGADAPKQTEANKFAARYRLATDLEEISFRSLSAPTVAGYSAGFRVGLAYSALESLERVLGEPNKRSHYPKSVEVIDPNLAHRFRSARMRKFAEAIAKAPGNPDLDRRLHAFFEDSAQGDVRPIAEKTRHMMFHGHFTAHGVGAVTQTSAAMLNDLSRAVLEAVDLYFAAWVSELASHR